MEDPGQHPKSANFLAMDLNLPEGEKAIEIPVRMSPEELIEAFEPFRLHWMKHHYDAEERRRSMNPERFVM